MQPRIVTLTQKIFVGKKLIMTFFNNQTFKLWQSFMPRRKEIKNNLTAELFSLQVYDGPLRPEDLNQKFEKWAIVEVSDFDNVPNEMETFTLHDGLYAVFNYKGLNTDDKIFIYIFDTWLPNSNYLLDDRPHFEILGDKYKNGDPNSEEEIWVPIKLKQ
ncbi:MAG: GyrI-like domain-containing protein [Bacteroidetes bacterium]|nr:GyrI-like domain-containing protein [Bacteroidota bacterium]